MSLIATIATAGLTAGVMDIVMGFSCTHTYMKCKESNIHPGVIITETFKDLISTKPNRPSKSIRGRRR